MMSGISSFIRGTALLSLPSVAGAASVVTGSSCFRSVFLFLSFSFIASLGKAVIFEPTLSETRPAEILVGSQLIKELLEPDVQKSHTDPYHPMRNRVVNATTGLLEP
ncbi:unnamed protein product [Pleuronectes platessa]|uniref:Uncharacterized protein n=1 Tax=Pleuronectes platessa TaxID=8262 RepID=A0A9N7VGD5_PLEPL|nr:unnamed protein product [Pleuronectes platessa]